MMNYIELVNQFWAVDVEHHFSDKEAALYFYLLNTCNSGKLRNPFRLSNNVTIARFGWGKASFDRSRKKLMEAGLIDFRQGLGRGNISQYIIKEVLGSYDESIVQASFEEGKNVCEKDTQTDLFFERTSEKGIQTDGFLSEKDAQTDGFSNVHNYVETHDIKAFQPFEIQKNENSLFEHNSSINILSNNLFDIDNKNIICENNEEKIENFEKKNENHNKSDKKNENEVVALFRRVCRSFPQIVRMTIQRKEKIMRRLSEMAEMGGIKILETIFRKMEASEFLKGNNKYGWRATFDWVFKNSENWIKILEGN